MTTTAPHPIRTPSARNRRFAPLWRLMDASIDEQIRPAKEAVFGDLPAQIVELGPGRGANFGYYPAGSRVIGFEPNPLFHDDLRAAAAEHLVDLDLWGTDLGAARLPDASQDAVVSTLVLCLVGDVAATLAEIHRILRPGGRFVFVEHVAERPGSMRSLYQRAVRRPWAAIADGCDTCADTVTHLDRSELEMTDARLEILGSRLDPTSLTYWGTAQKAA